jgi:Lar family restriction alleviation protein
MAKLKSCPFCGSTYVDTYRFMQVASENKQYVWCYGCDAHGPIMDGQLKARRAWNKRADIESDDKTS